MGMFTGPEIDASSPLPPPSVAELLALYGDRHACAAHLLCDRHDPAAIAYTIVAPDLTSSSLSFGDLRRESERLAAGLHSLGVRAGTRVATLMGKSRRYLVSVLAIWRLGAVHVPLFTAFATPAIAFRLGASRCKWVICDAAQRPKLSIEGVADDPPWHVITTGQTDATSIGYAELLERNLPGLQATGTGADWPIVEIYTSGTTGTPKGVIVPLRALAAFHAYARYGLDLRTDDVYWNAADPGWAYGLYYAVLAALATGTRSLIFEGGFAVEPTFEILRRFAITNFAAAPTVFRALRASGLAPPPGLRLRCLSSAGEPLTPEVNEWSRSALGLAVHDHYGQTETGMLINNHHHVALRRPLKHGSMGQSMPGWKAAILREDSDELASPGEAGRVAIDLNASSLAWFSGYVRDASRSAERFSGDRRWYFTGDAGLMDEDGYVYFSARDDDVIIMAGYRIGPFEVESVLVAHPVVAECAVVAAPDEVRGEVLEAFIVLRSGCAVTDELTPELQEWVKRRYAAHAYPRRVHYVDSLPRTPSGKVQRYVLRRRLRQERLMADSAQPS
jgi:acetyl-CoA synthetase